MAASRCPVCGGEPGPYRLGACGPRCDMVMGDDSSLLEAAAVAVMLLIVGVVLVILALTTTG